MSYKSIFTSYGLQRLAGAETSNTALNLTTMAVGDGNGNAVIPDENQTQLVRERYRTTPNRLYQAPSNSQQFIAELVVPADVGGFTLREIGIFDDNGSLILVGNIPAVYKPVSDEGAFGDTTVRVVFRVANASVISIVIDPNITVATQSWVTNNITAATIIPGGTVGQFLGKATNSDGAYEWKNPEGITVSVNTVFESQTLAAGQTEIALVETTTENLAVYIDGLRLDRGAGAGDWQADEADLTKLSLGQSYPDGTRISFYQNEPTGSSIIPLERNQNLADVPDKALARQNLCVYNTDEVDQRMRAPGDIFHTAAETAPPRSLKANGAAVSRTAYAKLFARINTRYGAGDGSTTFNLPDLRGEFIRGWDDGRGVDSERDLGSYQAGAYQTHNHTGTATSAGLHNHAASSAESGEHTHTTTFMRDRSPVTDGNAVLGDENYYGTQTQTTSKAGKHSHGVTIAFGGSHTHTVDIALSGGDETRPRNIALLACIAY